MECRGNFSAVDFGCGIAPQGLRHRAPSGWRGSGDVPGLLDRRRPPPALPGERCPRSLSRLAARAARVPTLAGWRRLVVPCGRAGVSSAHAGDGLAYGGAHSCGRARPGWRGRGDRKSTRLNSSHVAISYAVFCLKKKKNTQKQLIVDALFFIVMPALLAP